MDNHVVARSGLASLDDLKDPAARELFRQMELEQEAFLESLGNANRRTQGDVGKQAPAIAAGLGP